MKLAFSTVCCPTWDFETLVARAGELGYQGVELRASPNESALTASNVFLTEPGKIERLFAASGVQVCCLASSVEFAQSAPADARAAQQVKTFIDTAVNLNCPMVKMLDTRLKTGHSRATAAIAMAEWLLPLGDYAADRNVTILVENARAFRTAREMWVMLERLAHPSVAVAWDPVAAAQAGESPSVSVPTLNSRIQYVQMHDAKLTRGGFADCALGQGDIPLEKLVTRLRGIGYAGWLTVVGDASKLPALIEPAEFLRGAAEKLARWTRPAIRASAAPKAPAKASAGSK